MPAATVSYMDYPVYSVASDGNSIVISGGGGGKDYGIEDKLEIHAFIPESTQNQLSLVDCCSAGGVVDSLCYNENTGLFCGCCGSETLIFRIHKSSIQILHRFKPLENTNKRLITARFSPSGEFVITGGEDCCLRIWALKVEEAKQGDRENLRVTSEQVASLNGHTKDIKDCTMSMDNSLLVSCGGDGKLIVWQWREKRILISTTIPNPQKKDETLNIRCCRFLKNPTGGTSYQHRLLVLSAGTRGPSYVTGWSLTYRPSRENAAMNHQQSAHKTDESTADSATQQDFKMEKICNVLCDSKVPCCQLTISANEQTIGIGFADGQCKVYNRALKQLASHSKHDLPTTGVCFLNNGEMVLSTSADYSVAALSLTRQKSSWSCTSCLTWLFVLAIFLLISFAVFQHFLIVGHRTFIQKEDAILQGRLDMNIDEIISQYSFKEMEQQLDDDQVPGNSSSREETRRILLDKFPTMSQSNSGVTHEEL